ncbi:signal peptidase [Pedobacter lusitanus]|uniref:Signal peptidase I n=1 Tax=Pedobacter lusitanus TaxID=1503925 RepID=A0A0D0GRJ9_9SPHI|nr:signal peptidase I [Pedobacter lusitanus]KIO77146.1 signal peptidase [Pedobacter lusitanus]
MWFKKKKLKPGEKKSKAREWTDAVIFAVIAATIIRVFFIEAYVIPSGSMEKSLLIGDYLFVSKVNYGARIPMTPVAFPFAHHTMPLIGTKAYWDGVEWKYRRLPGLGAIQRNDVVVFNYPQGDTCALENQDADYYELLRHSGRAAVYAQYTIVSRPVDKRENFIKRCMATGGDVMAIKQGLVYVNGKAVPLENTGQTDYIVTLKSAAVNFEVFEDLGFVINKDIAAISVNTYQFTGSPEQMNKVKALDFVSQVKEIYAPAGERDPDIYPYDPNRKWNIDNMGPFVVPKKGWTVKLDSVSMPLYERAIRIYEGNSLEKKGSVWLLNGKPASSYTFKMNYYWMMGDNRHRSSDSRYWGPVPEDHIVGKALFVWMSHDTAGSFFNQIRWNRIFKIIR